MREDPGVVWRSRRPLGHDIVVAAWLFMSCGCSHVERHELGRETVASVDAPTKAHVELITIDYVETAGCGTSGGGGGRGGISLPSCSGSRCTSAHSDLHECELVVDREVSAKTRFGCTSKPRFVADAKGERFAVESAKGEWKVFAGGYAARLAILENTFVTPEIDWNAIPTAIEIALMDATKHDDGGALENVMKLDPAHIAENLASLVNADEYLEACPARSSNWAGVVASLPAPERVALGLVLVDQALANQEFSQVIAVHALRATSDGQLLDRIGNPAKWLDAHGREPPLRVIAGAILDAWSRKEPAAAAKWACAFLDHPVKSVSEMPSAAMVAIARAKLACPAVARTPAHSCERERSALDDLDASMSELAEAETEPFRTLFCEPEWADIAASRLADRKFDANALDHRCSALFDAGNEP